MTDAVHDRILANPKFVRLARERTRLAALLSAAVLAAYYGFMMVVAFQPGWLAQPLAESGVTPLGVPVGAAIVIGAWALTGIYIYRANTRFDALNAELLEEHAR